MNTYIVLDTETANSLEDPICYDIGWAVIDDEGNVLRSHSFVVADIFLNEPELMETAYFAEKIPQYQEDINNGSRQLRRLATIRKILREDCKEFNVQAIMAHNARFDYLSCNTSQRWLTSSKYRYFFPYGVEIWDTLKMARQTFGKMPEYKAFCIENGYVTARNQIRLTAEILYRFITGDNEFEEAHTGLEDVMIEKEIFKACMEIDPTIDRRLWA